MKIVDALVNKSEQLVFRELQEISSDNELKVFAKTRLSDIIQKSGSFLTAREFDFYTRSHCDFVVTDLHFRPILIVEYDGPYHASVKQKERDEIKNYLCRSAGLGLLRIQDQHVTRLYRGMTVLRWIVEVIELEKAFYHAQQNGIIPYDEIFDPAFITPVSSQKKFPYWLSAPSNKSIQKFLKTFSSSKNAGMSCFTGADNDGTSVQLSFLSFDDQIIFAKNSVRKQDLDFPHLDLLNEINICELNIKLQNFIIEKQGSISSEAFLPKLKNFCDQYNLKPSSLMGRFPFSNSFSF